MTPSSSPSNILPANVGKRTSWALSHGLDNLQIDDSGDDLPSFGSSMILRSAMAVNRERQFKNKSSAVPFRIPPDAPLGTMSLNDGDKTRTKDKGR